MAIVFSTSDVHPRDRLAYWREVATKGFVGHEFRSSVGQSYRGRLRLGSIASLVVAAYECDPGDVVRSERDVRSGDDDGFLVGLVIAGHTDVDQDGRHAVVDGATFGLLDPRRPFTGRMTTALESVIVKVPRAALEARLGDVSSLTARALDAKKPLAGLAYGFLTMLPDCMDALDGPAAARVAAQALDLLALALADETQNGVLALSSPRAVALLRLKSAIEAQLDDPELKPVTASAAAGMSVRDANALLAEEDTSLERFILSRRLDRCRRALEDPAHGHRTVGEIAYGWGFSDLSHFGRRFKAEFGLSPSDYRRQPRSRSTVTA